MSQKYTCKVAVKESVKSDDEIRQKIDLAPIISADDMKALLRKELEADGWAKIDGDVYVKIDGDVKSTLEIGTMEVAHTVEKTIEVDEEVRVTADHWELEDSKKAAQDGAKKRIEARLKHAKDEAAAHVLKVLTDVEAKKTGEVQSVLRKVYAEALKQKARKMGDVLEQTEGTNDKGEYELIIKVAL